MYFGAYTCSGHRVESASIEKRTKYFEVVSFISSNFVVSFFLFYFFCNGYRREYREINVYRQNNFLARIKFVFRFQGGCGYFIVTRSVHADYSRVCCTAVCTYTCAQVLGKSWANILRFASYLASGINSVACEPPFTSRFTYP